MLPLHEAAALGNKAGLIAELKKPGQDKDSQDSQENSALHFAVRNGHLKVAERLLKEGASVDPTDYLDMTPLHHAASAGHHDTVKLLLKYRASATKQTHVYDRNPIYFAVSNGHIETVQVLLQYGASIEDECTRDDDPPLHVAASSGQLAMMRFLIEKNRTLVNQENYKNGHTALHEAVNSGNLDAVELLLKNGADINAKTHHGDTLLHFSPSNYIELTNGFHKTKLNRQAAALPFLLEKSPHLINVKNNNGTTPLHAIIWHGNLVMAELLLKNGASINERDNNGLTALELYMIKIGPISPDMTHHIPMIRLLIKKGAEVSKQLAESHPIVEQERARRVVGLTLVAGTHPRLNGRSFFSEILRHSLWDRQVLRLPLKHAGVMPAEKNKPPVEPFKSPRM